MKARPQGSATSGSTSTAKQAAFDNLAAYCPDLEQWPRSWRREERDVPRGEKIVEYFTPFLRHLLNSNLSRATCANIETTSGCSAVRSSESSTRPQGSGSSRWQTSCLPPSMRRADRFSPTLHPKKTSAHWT